MLRLFTDKSKLIENQGAMMVMVRITDLSDRSYVAELAASAQEQVIGGGNNYSVVANVDLRDSEIRGNFTIGIIIG